MSLKIFSLSLTALIVMLLVGFFLFEGVRKLNDFFWLAYLMSLGLSGITIIMLIISSIQWFFYGNAKLFGYCLILIAFSCVLFCIGRFAKWDKLF